MFKNRSEKQRSCDDVGDMLYSTNELHGLKRHRVWLREVASRGERAAGNEKRQFMISGAYLWSSEVNGTVVYT